MGGGGTCGLPPSLDVIRGGSPELVMGEDLHELSVTAVAVLNGGASSFHDNSGSETRESVWLSLT